MTKRQTEKRGKLRSGRLARFVGALAMAFGVLGLPVLCPAAEPLGAARPGGVPEVLASATVLSEAAMANEKAAGIQAAPIIGDQTGHPRVMLWDELKAPPELPPGVNGTVTLTTGVAGK